MSTYLGSQQLVPGRPASWWSSAHAAFTVGLGILVIAAVIVGALVLQLDRGAFIVPVIAVVAVSSTLTLLAMRRGFPNENREVAAGYTTLYRSHQELPQVDPKTGAVIRAAGEPFIPRKTLWARLRL
ncbi:MAG: hypothetical protein BGO97_11770 [Micrococcales bacterium 70-64]|nr:hypothetical protein [Leifsonia sp.]ODU64644.1 MAG: hypothetical protein ABT06_11770 [Leifsonia sp. SCN 70-46]OJX86335.1 MAG: hypothetical protein BGO97_11770 [Micrococcales bacterium 70-64]